MRCLDWLRYRGRVGIDCFFFVFFLPSNFVSVWCSVLLGLALLCSALRCFAFVSPVQAVWHVSKLFMWRLFLHRPLYMFRALCFDCTDLFIVVECVVRGVSLTFGKPRTTPTLLGYTSKSRSREDLHERQKRRAIRRVRYVIGLEISKRRQRENDQREKYGNRGKIINLGTSGSAG